MVLVGVTIEDGASDGFFDVLYLALDGSNKSTVANRIPTTGFSQPNTNNPLAVNPSNEDLEGIARAGGTRAIAISESAFAPGGDKGVTIRSIDKSNIRLENLRGDTRTGDDSGYAAQVIDGQIIGYNVQGSDEVAPIGTAFYRVDPPLGNNPRTVVEIKSSLTFGGNNEFVDGLAIRANNSRFAIGSDLEGADGDGNELYTINLNTGAIADVARIQLIDEAGNVIAQPGQAFNSDSGLDITAGGQKMYLIADKTNDLFELVAATGATASIPALIAGASNKGSLPGGNLVFQRVGNFANEGTVAGLGEMEGLAVIDVAGNPFA